MHPQLASQLHGVKEWDTMAPPERIQALVLSSPTLLGIHLTRKGIGRKFNHRHP